jgi:hypothetical protein
LKTIEGYLTFFSKDKRPEKTCCIEEAEVDVNGKFSGVMHDCAEPENVMRITKGEFDDESSCEFDFDSAGEAFKVILNTSAAVISCGHAELGLTGKYFKVKDGDEGAAFVFAAFRRLK